MKKTIEKYGEKDFKIPEGIVHLKINKKTGKLLKSEEQGGFIESFIIGSGPDSLAKVDEDNEKSNFDYEEDYNY